MFSLRPMNTPDQAKRTDTGQRRSKPPEPICECENSVALNHLAILGGLGLLAHCAEFGECLSEGSPAKRVGNPTERALNPLHRIDPRSRFLPRLTCPPTALLIGRNFRNSASRWMRARSLNASAHG